MLFWVGKSRERWDKLDNRSCHRREWEKWSRPLLRIWFCSRSVALRKRFLMMLSSFDGNKISAILWSWKTPGVHTCEGSPTHNARLLKGDRILCSSIWMSAANLLSVSATNFNLLLADTDGKTVMSSSHGVKVKLMWLSRGVWQWSRDQCSGDCSLKRCTLLQWLVHAATMADASMILEVERCGAVLLEELGTEH